MRSFLRCVGVCLLGVSILSGCGREEKAPEVRAKAPEVRAKASEVRVKASEVRVKASEVRVKAPEVRVKASSADGDVVLAYVNGHPITSSNVRDRVLLMGRVLSRKPIKEKDLRPWVNGKARQVLAQLVESELMERRIEALGLRPTASDTAAVLAKYNHLKGTKAKSVEDFAKIVGGDAAAFRQQFDFDCKMNALYASNTNLVVTGRDLRRYFVNATNRLHKCKRINAAARKKIADAHARLKAGAGWEAVATNVTEDALLEKSFADNWRDWQSVDEKNVEPAALRKALEKLKDGEFTPPIETNEGMIIVRLVSRDGGLLNLARILVRTAIDFKIPDDETARREIVRRKRVSFQRAILEELHKTAKIDYPLGRNFKHEIWPAPKPQRTQKNANK